MDNYKNIQQQQNSMIIKGDIFSDYLNFNSFQNSLLNTDFAKPDNETFDKFFNNDESSIKSLNSLNEYSKNNISKSVISNRKDSQSSFYSLNNNLNTINNDKEKSGVEENKDNKMKKNIFSIFSNKEKTTEERKIKKLMMNRESAKKSRLKKKNYVKNLEKQYNILKEEYIKIIEKKNANNNNFIYNNNQLIFNQNIDISNNKTKNNLISLEVQKPINKKKEENKTISKNIFENSSFNNNLNNQKKSMVYILINQIDLLTPIKIKAFQNKFLKFQILESDDSLEVIKNKINMNLNNIIELYGFDSENYSPTINISINKKSIAYQLYEYYKDIKLLVNNFENIYNFESI